MYRKHCIIHNTAEGRTPIFYLQILCAIMHAATPDDITRQGSAGLPPATVTSGAGASISMSGPSASKLYKTSSGQIPSSFANQLAQGLGASAHGLRQGSGTSSQRQGSHTSATSGGGGSHGRMPRRCVTLSDLEMEQDRSNSMTASRCCVLAVLSVLVAHCIRYTRSLRPVAPVLT